MQTARPLESGPFSGKRRQKSFSGLRVSALLASTTLLVVVFSASSTPPEIQLIERFSTNQVLLHFDTDANRTYILQYTDKPPTNGVASTNWSNLYTTYSLPTPDHYIVPDYRTNKMRFYRLKVTP